MSFVDEVTQLTDAFVLDIDCVYLSKIVVDWEEQRLSLFGQEGFGSFQSTTSGYVESDFDMFEIEMTLPELIPTFFRRMVRRAERWRDSQTPLRVIQARGKMAVILEDERTWLVIPTKGK